MYKPEQIIAVDGAIYEYIGFDESLNLHRLSEIAVDENGILTYTYRVCYFSTEELANNEVNFTKNQWYGIVECFLIGDYSVNLEYEEIKDATVDIVERCFVYGIPKIHELTDYIAEYMNR